ncbi:MAG: hypothetical protein JW754_01995 [Candidatus Aenigmarchaeota archaeon]|nr:hypothetical protein [Candidatus Aenigmarchaeota archaeon]
MFNENYATGTRVRLNYVEDEDVVFSVFSANRREGNSFRMLRGGEAVPGNAAIYYVLDDGAGHAMTQTVHPHREIIIHRHVMYFPENLLDSVE